MKVTVRYPAVVKSKIRGGRKERLAVILPEGEFNIRDLESSQAPLAFVVSDEKYGKRTEREIRSFDGRLYGQVEEQMSYHIEDRGPTNLDDIINALSSNPLSRKGFLRQIVEKARSAVVNFKGENAVPSGIHNGLYSKVLTDGTDLVEACIALTDQIVVDDEIRAEMAKWHASTQAVLDQYVTVDGVAFKFCGEPIYNLSDSSVDIYYPETADNFRRIGSGYTFAATSRDEALAAYALAYSRRDPEKYWGGNDSKRIEIIDPAAVTWRGEEQDFDRFAYRCASSMYGGIKCIYEKNSSIRIPRAIYDAWLDLRDLLDSYDPAKESVPEELEGVLVKAIDTWRPFQEGLGIDLYQVVPPIGVVDAFVARFSDRPIDMAPIPGHAAPGLNG